MINIAKFVPIVEQLQNYNREKLSGEFTAAAVVTIMLIPQSLAYAMLAGLPPETDLYASILPLLAYAILGSCRTLAVGPVAIASLMTASALATVTQQGIIGALEGAMLLALLSDLFYCCWVSCDSGFCLIFCLIRWSPVLLPRQQL